MLQQFTARQTTSVILLAIVAGCIPALQPLLLGSLLIDGRIDAVMLGRTATVEATAMLVGVALATLLLQPERLRLVASLAVLSMVAANAATAVIDAAFLPWARGVAGLAGGVLLWLLLGLMARAGAAGRLFAIYVTVQAVLAFTLSFSFSTWIVPVLRSTGAYATIAAVAVLLIVPAALFIPRSYRPLASSAGLTLPTGPGLIGLGASFAFLAGVASLWTYLMPIGAALGHQPAQTARLIAIAVAFQIAGGLMATYAVQRLGAAATCAGCAVIGALTVCGMWFTGEAALPFAIATSAFSLLWMFAPPFHVPLILGLDPSGRSALHIGSAQLGGAATGPLAASLTILSGSYFGVVAVSILFFGASAVLSAVAAVTTRFHSVR